MRALAWVCLVLCVMLSPGRALAHGMRSAYLEIVEHEAGHAIAVFRLTAPARGVSPVFPAGCTAVPEGGPQSTDSGEARSYRLSCATALAGQEVGVEGLGPVITEAVVWVTLADGQVHSRLLAPSEPRLQIPRGSASWEVSRRYIGLGVEHIATGADHLLFLLLLVLTLRRPRAVLLAETAFSISHGLSFAATALGLLTASPAAAEACIALSLLLVALDVGRDGARRPSAWEGAALALVFGVVHGLGFAGGLREVGVPEDHAAAALAGFGLGVELGQLAFVLLALGLVHAAAKTRALRGLSLAVAYASGAVASFWLIARVLVVVSPQ